VATANSGTFDADELRRDARVIDQTTSMQAVLRDRDARIEYALTSAMVVLSMIGVAFAFATDRSELTLLGVEASRATWLGLLAVLAGIVGIVDLVADRRGAARRRGEAVVLLSSLAAEYRQALTGQLDESEVARLNGRYVEVATRVPEIPERQFNRLKARHLRKVEISKELSRNPGLAARIARRRVMKRAKGS